MIWLLIGGIMAFIVISVFAILLIPLTIRLDSVRSEGKIKGIADISWLMLQLRYALKDERTELFIFGLKIAILSKPEEKRNEAKVVPSAKKILDISVPLLRLLKELYAAFRLRYLDLEITYGLIDPAYTGIMTGFLHAVCGSFWRSVRFVPDFTGRPVLDWKIRAKATIKPVQIVLPVARFVSTRHSMYRQVTFSTLFR